ncbi:DUF3054 domain-containing protein [Halorubellus sp. PRR65]|uniref:DUF3054 domain-containing protein n=1 Tax=Halorubellus sp. PRR65 TaxID=3098148 RepID=UPI002B25B6F7|nr:DUF3054 domain-containing protein [Halorubellus sp. PRR65]
MNALARVLDAESVPLPAVGSLAAADVATLLALVVAGELRHGVDVVGNPGQVLATAAPFLLGWFLVAALVGAYGDRAFAGGVDTLRLTVGAWLGGAGVGLTLRGTSYLAGDSPLSFALVMMGLGTLALGVVRPTVVSRLRSRR